jgi:hypothetical protein
MFTYGSKNYFRMEQNTVSHNHLNSNKSHSGQDKQNELHMHLEPSDLLLEAETIHKANFCADHFLSRSDAQTLIDLQARVSFLEDKEHDVEVNLDRSHMSVVSWFVKDILSNLNNNSEPSIVKDKQLSRKFLF